MSEQFVPIEKLNLENNQPKKLEIVRQSSLLQPETLPLLESERILSTEIAANEIIDKFSISKELFDDRNRQIVFGLIAQRYDRLGEVKPEDAAGEHQFLEDAISLLAHAHSPRFSELHHDIKGELSEEETKEIVGAVTNEELTIQIQQAIKERGLLDAVRDRLGLSSETEFPYELRVVNLYSSDDSHGLRPMRSEELSLAWDNEDWEVINRLQPELDAATDVYEQWEQELKSNTVEYNYKLSNGINTKKEVSPAWVSKAGQHKELCIPVALARKLIGGPSAYDNELLSEQDMLADIATLEHEYVHTQSGMHVDDSLYFGLGLEELRAEHFSGNHAGYGDVKTFFNDIGLILNRKIVDILSQKGYSTNTEKVYSEISAQINGDLLLEILLMMPRSYIKDNFSPGITLEIVQRIDHYLGGYNGVVERLLQYRTSIPGELERIEDAIDSKAQFIRNMDSEIDPFDVLDYLKNSTQCTIILDKVIERLKFLQTNTLN